MKKCLDCKQPFNNHTSLHVRCGSIEKKTGCAWKHRKAYWNNRYQKDPHYRELVLTAVRKYQEKRKLLR